MPSLDPDRGEPRFRFAGLEDVPAIVTLVDAAYRGEASRAGWTTEADLLEGQRTDGAAVTELIVGPASRVLLVVSQGQLVACCHLAEQGMALYLGMFAVRPDCQGEGLGSAVVAEANRLAQGLGASCIRMTVIGLRLDLLAWYSRLGFEPTGEVEPFPYGDERFGIPTRPDLELVVLERPVA